jgi:RNA polymerase sigma factor for flagellar operon FliA
MGVEVDGCRRMLGEMRTVGLVSTAVQTADDQDRTQDFPNTPEGQPDRVCARRQMRKTLARAIGVLPERYQKVVFLYYTNEMTMKEIGEIFGVNESRVSQIHKTALKKVASALESEGIQFGGGVLRDRAAWLPHRASGR